MACDSILYTNGMRAGNLMKIARHEKSGALIGAAGDAGECQNLLALFKEHGLTEKFEPALTEAIGLIAAKGGQLWVVQHDVVYQIEDPFYAIGSGAPYAMGAMAAGRGAPKAILIAMEYDDGTGGQLRILRHDKKAACTE